MFSDPKIDSKAELRKMIRDQINMTIHCNPLNALNTAIEGLTDWVLGMTGIHNDTMFGLTPAQVFHLKAYYEAKTGKKAEGL